MKIQMYYKQPIMIGPLGRIYGSRETFGTPLGLMSVIPGNQTPLLRITFSNLNFYEFVTDQYDLSGITISAVALLEFLL
jgi:hypothetical protein